MILISMIMVVLNKAMRFLVIDMEVRLLDIGITIHFIKLEREYIPLYAKAREKMVFVQITEHGIMD
jgi:hypothetical protein